ncbi:MAG: flagellar hook-length control protein FliK [Acidobacteriota bacterium]
MQISGVDLLEQRLQILKTAITDGLTLELGSQHPVQVLKVDPSGQVLLDLNSKKFWAGTSLPLEVGQKLQVQVAQTSPVIELRLIPQDLPATLVNGPLAEILGHRGALPGKVDPADVESWLNSLKAELLGHRPSLNSEQLQQLERLLAPLELSSNSQEIVPQLRNLLENSGVFFEAKLRALLESYSARIAQSESPSESADTVLGKLAEDLKVLLGTLSRNAPQGGAETRPALLNLQAEPSTGDALPLSAGPLAAVRSVLEKLLTPVGVAETGAPERDFRELVAALHNQAQGASSPLERTALEHRLHLAQELIAALEAPPGETESRIRQILAKITVAPQEEMDRLGEELKRSLEAAQAQVRGGSTQQLQKPALTETHQLLAGNLLNRQTEVAYHWMRDGTFCAEVPVQLYAEQGQARIRFFLDSSRKQGRSTSGPKTVDIFLELPEWGRVEAWAQWQDTQLQSRIYVESAEVKERFDAQLQDLQLNLQSAGFEQVRLDVQVDPVRLYKPDKSDPSHEDLSEGSLLSIRI